MPFNESDKAALRGITGSAAFRNWMEYARQSVPKLKLGDSTQEIYNISLQQKEGWLSCLEFLESSLQEAVYSDAGTQSIDTVRD
jgi:hypothetical protein